MLSLDFWYSYINSWDKKHPFIVLINQSLFISTLFPFLEKYSDKATYNNLKGEFSDMLQVHFVNFVTKNGILKW